MKGKIDVMKPLDTVVMFTRWTLGEWQGQEDLFFYTFLKIS